VASFKVIFLGLSVVGPEEETRLLGGLQKKFNLTPGRAESLLQRVPIVVKKGVSKEEAERYARAFGEIGGRVKVEEEPLLNLEITQEDEPKPGPRLEPQPTFARRAEPERKPYTGVMVTCPQCGFEQPETDECVKCGIIISKYVQFQEMARSIEGQVREISPEEYTSWESGEGFFRAFYRTTRDALFSPTQFFKKISFGKGYWAPLIYGVIAGIIGSFGGIFWQWLIMNQFFPFSRILAAIPYGIILIIIIIAMPFMVAFSIFLGSGITHLCLMIVGGNKKGFEKTFQGWSIYFMMQCLDSVPDVVLKVYEPCRS